VNQITHREEQRQVKPVSMLLLSSNCSVNTVADHFDTFITFAGASYIWHDNVRPGTVGDR
jgi:hypothetical protein